jgi:hypothetical protein
MMVYVFFCWNRIESTRMKGVTFKNTFDRKIAALENTMLRDSLNGISTTGGMKTAGGLYFEG